jgi:hypothetical protein
LEQKLTEKLQHLPSLTRRCTRLEMLHYFQQSELTAGERGR